MLSARIGEAGMCSIVTEVRRPHKAERVEWREDRPACGGGKHGLKETLDTYGKRRRDAEINAEQHRPNERNLSSLRVNESYRKDHRRRAAGGGRLGAGRLQRRDPKGKLYLKGI